MAQEFQCFTLGERLDAAAGRRLVGELRKYRGRPVRVDADGVEIISGLALEVLLSAVRQWQEDGQDLIISSGSEPFRSACATLALKGILPVTDDQNGTAA